MGAEVRRNRRERREASLEDPGVLEEIPPATLEKIARGMVRGILEEMSPAQTSRLFNVTAVVDGYRTVMEWKRVAFPPDCGGYTILSLPIPQLGLGVDALTERFGRHSRIELRIELVVDPPAAGVKP